MKKTIYLLSAISFIVAVNILSSGCKYNVEEELYPVNDCDTTAVSYASQIVPILQDACYGCHAADVALYDGNGIILDNHAGVLPFADNGILTCTIEFGADCAAMPQNGEQLNTCNLALINSWVNAGAPNN